MSHRLLPAALSLALIAVVPRSGPAEDLTAGLSPEQLREIDAAVDRGLRWIAGQQNADGSFSDNSGPATLPSAYALMAFLSRGHQPGRGKYGRCMSRAIDFLAATQRDDGSFSARSPDQKPKSYTHALTGLALCETYGAMSAQQAERVSVAIQRALMYSRKVQLAPKLDPAYEGGWFHGDQDWRLSSSTETCWELTFLRSAHNAGFAVPHEWIDSGVKFIEGCYKPGPLLVGTRRVSVGSDHGVFYAFPIPPPGRRHWANFNTTAAGMLAMQLNGRREDARVQKAAAWFADAPVPSQNSIPRFYFGCYMTSQAMAQSGGEHWNLYFPRLVDRLVPHQAAAGHWRLDGYIGWGDEDKLGPVYYSALAILCLTLPDQLLPIHQR